MTGSWERRTAGAPPPCGGVASFPNARLDTAFWEIHRRGLGAPGPDPGVPPLAPDPPLDAGRPGPFTPLRCPGFGEGSQAVTNPQKEPSFFNSASRRCTRLEFLGVGHGSLPWAATAQQPNQDGIAGAQPSFGSAWGQSRWSCGRPSPRLGTRVPGSFTSNLSLHVNRIGGRFAGAHLTA